MRYALLFGALVLLAREGQTAPKIPENQVVAHIVQGRSFRSDRDSGALTPSGRAHPGFRFNGTNATTSGGTGTAVAGVASSIALPLNTTKTTSRSLGCPLSIITSTMTVDVTFYITATTSYGSNLTSYIGTDSPLTSSQSILSSTTSHVLGNISLTSSHLSTGFIDPIASSYVSVATTSTVSKSLCPEEITKTQLPQTNTTTKTSFRHSDISTMTISPSESYRTESCENDSRSTYQSSTVVTVSGPLMNSTTDGSLSTTSTSRHTNSTAIYASNSQSTSESLVNPGSLSPVSSMPAPDCASTISQTITDSSSSLSKTVSTHTSVESITTRDSSEDHSSIRISETLSDISSTSIQGIMTSSSKPDPATSTSTNTPASWTSQTTETISFSISSTADTQITSGTHLPTSTESCVIDTSMIPITSAPLTSVPSSTLEPSRTVCQNDAPTGKPMPENHHCGVHGLPVGNYFLARFVENAPGVRVTLEGCYQFCNSVMSTTDGCKAYRFYPEKGLNVPRCDLYGSNVAYALNSIDNDHADIWFDLTCGSPSDQKWAHLPGMARLRELGLLE
ncbi:uncharacterized protein CTRU02_206015 [Colletotrichum truncatum]|uniref:Uncharacterized protein n=1 Tax=Colletotrichum truncatum TaxID=5467 RepID=A0ACC3Z5Y9_COLTU|nr:uncharacterized protein CTRU02_04851 [Colletotrichum truncatum]KAF6795289.1 hypothetical protein CTRU02_04851 [Colletotrichum truncatum]